MEARVAQIHKPLVSASKCARQNDAYISAGGGWLIPKDSEVAKRIRKLLYEESLKRDHKMLAMYEERGVYNFYLRMGKSVKSVDEVSRLTREELEARLRKAETRVGGSRQPATSQA